MLKLWAWPSNYAGAEWPEWFVFLGQHRDSDCLARSNFRSALKALGGKTDSVHVVRENHWAVGWVEWIAIHRTDWTALVKAEAVLERLDAYPVVSDDDWSSLEYEEKCDYWEHASIRDRVWECQQARVSVFAARRDEIPERVYDRIEV